MPFFYPFPMQELVTAIIILYIVPVSCGILYHALYVLQSCTITALKKASKIIECVQKNTYTACEKTHLPVEKRMMHFCLS